MTDSGTAGNRSELLREKTLCLLPTLSALHGKEGLVILSGNQVGRGEGAPHLAKMGKLIWSFFWLTPTNGWPPHNGEHSSEAQGPFPLARNQCGVVMVLPGLSCVSKNCPSETSPGPPGATSCY